MTECGATLVVHYPVLEPDAYPANPDGQAGGDYWIEIRCQAGLPERPDHTHADGEGVTWPGIRSVTHIYKTLKPPPTYAQSGPFRVRID